MGQKNKNISNVDFANGKATVSSDFYNDGIDHYVVPCSDDVLLKQPVNSIPIY